MIDHDFFMNKCIALGKETMKEGNPPVGALIVKNDEIIGIGKEATKSCKDITKHAEIEAVKAALKTQLRDLKGCTLYTTHEPCVMCSYVIRHYQVKTIVYGVRSKHIGGKSSKFKLLETNSIPHWKEIPEIIEGVLEIECLSLSEAYQNKK